MDALPSLNMFDMIFCLSSAMDLVSPAVVSHQKRVACIASGLAREMDLPANQQVALLYAGMLHDCGALSLQSKLDALRFDFDLNNPHQHSEAGYAFLREFESLFPSLAAAGLSTLVRYHHVAWEGGRGLEFRGQPVPAICHLLHLADRVDVLIRHGQEILGQAPTVLRTMTQQAGNLFAPELVESFRSLASREAFWLDLAHPEALQARLISNSQAEPPVILDQDSLLGLARIFAHMVDFRSRFTAVHSSGVAAVAGELAGLAGFSRQEIRLITVAGFMHDLGKLAVPTEILEKPGPLSPGEFDIMKAHPHHAYRLLSPLRELGQAVGWMAFHHETLDRQGYPFHHGPEELNLGARIITVSDIFTALTEDRPYRPGMSPPQAVGILQDLAAQGKLDHRVVDLAREHSQAIDHHRASSQSQGLEAYQQVQPYL